jgi:hypothetical protein
LSFICQKYIYADVNITLPLNACDARIFRKWAADARFADLANFLLDDA